MPMVQFIIRLNNNVSSGLSRSKDSIMYLFKVLFHTCRLMLFKAFYCFLYFKFIIYIAIFHLSMGYMTRISRVIKQLPGCVCWFISYLDMNGALELLYIFVMNE